MHILNNLKYKKKNCDELYNLKCFFTQCVFYNLNYNSRELHTLLYILSVLNLM